MTTFPKINILNYESQLNRFKMLERDDFLARTNGEYKIYEMCERFDDCHPTSVDTRVFVRDKIPTNGAEVFDKNVVISGPHNQYCSQLLWSICAEKVMEAVVRIGVPASGDSCEKQDTCCTYTPTPEKPIEFTNIDGIDFPFIISQPQKEKTTIPQKNITQTQYQIQYGTIERKIAYFAIEDWVDMKGYSVEKLYSLLKVLSVFKKIIVHCRGGIGRSGVLITCLKIYKDFLEARRREEKMMDVDPAGIVKNLRNYRRLAVQNDEQFEFILKFIEYLNTLKE